MYMGGDFYELIYKLLYNILNSLNNSGYTTVTKDNNWFKQTLHAEFTKSTGTLKKVKLKLVCKDGIASYSPEIEEGYGCFWTIEHDAGKWTLSATATDGSGNATFDVYD